MMRRMTTSSQSSTQVSIGPSSILGWLAAAAGLVTSTVLSLEHSQALAAGPGKWPAILAVVALVGTNAGRQFQAAHLGKAAAVAAGVAKVPDALAALAAQAQANVARVEASPDGVDGPHVAFSTEASPEQTQAPSSVAPLAAAVPTSTDPAA